MIHINNLHKRFGDSHVLRGISCDIKPQEVVCIIGPSGSGKSTFLRCMNALETVSEGEVVVNGFAAHDRTTDLNKMRESVGMVFQRFNLFPHMTVLENLIMAPMNLRNMPRQQAIDLAEALLAKVGLSDKRDAWPSSLSGGQQQRVAIARALVNHPKVLLLDEPLGALDLKLRKEMQIELKRIQQSLEITFIYVTHDQEEALTMSDRVVVMKDGYIQQIGTPQDIYNEPANAFVADFIGESNIMDGLMYDDFKVQFAGNEFECVDKGFGQMKRVDVVVRPEDVKVVAPDEGQLNGVVNSVIFKGVHFEMMVEAAGYNWMIHSTKMEEPGSIIGMRIDPFDIHIMHKMEDEE